MPWVEADGVSLHYRLSGKGAQSVVLLHEMGGSAASWDGVLPLLGPEFRMLCPDFRGAGLSETVGAPFSVAELTEDLWRVLAAADLPPPWHIGAVAFGAAVAVAFAAAHPGQVASLLLCCPATSVDPGRVAYLMERADHAARAGMRAVADASLARSYPPEATRDAKRRAEYRVRFLAGDPVSYGLANKALAEARLDGPIAALRCPCLVLAGEHDLLRPPDAVQALAARIPGAGFAVINSGHLAPVQAPDAVAAHMRGFFLSVTQERSSHG